MVNHEPDKITQSYIEATEAIAKLAVNMFTETEPARLNAYKDGHDLIAQGMLQIFAVITSQDTNQPSKLRIVPDALD